MAMTDLLHADLHEKYGTKAYSSLTMHRLGLWLFIISDAFFFAALISSRYFVDGTSRPDTLIQELGLVLTAVLLLSSLSAYRAEVAASHGDTEGAKRWILLTILAGLVFLGGVVFEWYEAFHDFPPSTGFGTTFFTLTGIHTTHVISGIILLAFVYRRAARG
ncbi:MAG: heme-copper oxidase subunit III, partial [Chloroflexi bacterium]|nr:heme-copper oxidase subunit III [Chloroflexota bacterium]